VNGYHRLAHERWIDDWPFRAADFCAEFGNRESALQPLGRSDCRQEQVPPPPRWGCSIALATIYRVHS